jgi:hypothetical protein
MALLAAAVVMVNSTPMAQPENFLKSFSVHKLAKAQSARKSVSSKPKRPTLVATLEDDVSGVRVVHAAKSVVVGSAMFSAKT